MSRNSRSPASARSVRLDLPAPTGSTDIGLLSARRPRATPFSSDELTPKGSDELAHKGSDSSVQASEPPSPEGGGNFGHSMQIDMKNLVGDAVGNMSISPSSRDVVLAARRGLFIIDLEEPLNVPRFLPQGGTWDVADVQWNPHPSRAEYIVSTSSEKLLIWNLLIVGKTSINHILRSHYRAITDINWHTTEPDTVVSTGIDSWLWAWDLRETRKPILGLCAFNAGGTQVKWNRRDANILASSHMNEVLIWDRRKGSMPLTRIKAHSAKIYGIDWTHYSRNEIVTCSLDKTIKVWDIDAQASEGGQHVPQTTISTTYPVWRARDLPFGRGVLSLPQRSENALEMWSYDDALTPVESFEGHTDVVKEFVWRRGNQGGTDFQLITWSKDRTLRFWPQDPEITQKIGHGHGSTHTAETSDVDSAYTGFSFRNLPIGTDYPPALSAPVGHRSILAGVRAPPPPRPPPGSQRFAGTGPRERPTEKMAHLHDLTNGPKSLPVSLTGSRPGGTMSRGGVGGKSARVDPLAWFTSVKAGESRESSSRPGSGGGSGKASRVSSASRPPSRQDDSPDLRPRSESRGRDEGDGIQFLQNEITSVLTKLPASKIKLEKHDLTKKRTCTLGLHGPWGDHSSVFVRVSFTFPKDYPHAPPPGGTPSIELEKTPLITNRARALILRRLRAIAAHQRPCLEPCLKFLLYEDDLQQPGGQESESSSEGEDDPVSRKGRDATVALAANVPGIVEPRTSQGIFGPNGELICFFRAPPRLVRNPAATVITRTVAELQPRPTGLLQPPALLSDAVRRLGLSAKDRPASISTDAKGPVGTGDNLLRVMTNLLTSDRQRLGANTDPKSASDSSASYSLVPVRRSMLCLMWPADITQAEKSAAKGYIFEADTLEAVCERNAKVARTCGRFDHERAFRILLSAVCSRKSARDLPRRHSIAQQIADRLYAELLVSKDIQLLAMTSVILFQASRSPFPLPTAQEARLSSETPLASAASRLNGADYFSLSRRKENINRVATSPNWPRLSSSPAATGHTGPSLSTSNSSRGSWSSLFNAGGMRHFMAGMQDTFKDGSTPMPFDLQVSRLPTGTTIPVPPGAEGARGQDSPRLKGSARDSSAASSAPKLSWSDGSIPLPSPLMKSSSGSAGHIRRPTFSQTSTIPEKVLVFNRNPSLVHTHNTLTFDPHVRQQLVCHIMQYANCLFAWELPHKRAEMLKSVQAEIHQYAPFVTVQNHEYHDTGLAHTCARCGMRLLENALACTACGNLPSKPGCSVCRLPVKGLSHTCARCLHVTHISCWKGHNSRHNAACATGCGCICDPPPRVGFLDGMSTGNAHVLSRSPLSLLSGLPLPP